MVPKSTMISLMIVTSAAVKLGFVKMILRRADELNCVGLAIFWRINKAVAACEATTDVKAAPNAFCINSVVVLALAKMLVTKSVIPFDPANVRATLSKLAAEEFETYVVEDDVNPALLAIELTALAVLASTPLPLVETT